MHYLEGYWLERWTVGPGPTNRKPSRPHDAAGPAWTGWTEGESNQILAVPSCHAIGRVSFSNNPLLP